MDTLISKTPAETAGSLLHDLIASHDGLTVCFLSGGSALEVVRELNLSETLKGRTIFMMGDERWSRERTENNYLQLIDSLSSDHGLNIINTEVLENENLGEFSTRLNLEFLKIISKNNSTIQTIALLGIGTDGHIASIFPMKNESFCETYKADSTYVPVDFKGLKIAPRASLTPNCIQKLDHLVSYAVSEAKKPILKWLINETKPINEMPAQIIKNHKSSVLVTDQDITL